MWVLGILLIWTVSLAGWVFISTFLHEVFHLVISRLAGFKIREFRLISVPGGPKGYVDVLVSMAVSRYYLKRGLMHISGILAHVLMVIVSFVLWHISVATLYRGVFFIGGITNIYFIIMNTCPEESDGRQFMSMMRARSGRKG